MRGPRLGVRIGVDVGSVRVGVARSDPSGLLATPVATLARTAGDLPDVQDADVVTLAGIVHDEAAIEVVVGLPRTLAGGEGAAAAKARQYAVRPGRGAEHRPAAGLARGPQAAQAAART